MWNKFFESKNLISNYAFLVHSIRIIFIWIVVPVKLIKHTDMKYRKPHHQMHFNSDETDFWKP